MRLRLPLIAATLMLAMPLFAENWPEYRGPSADGIVKAIGLPTKWSDKENVKWKTPLPGRAWSSPVIWDNQIWLTNATPDGTEMYAVCIEKKTGKILLNEKLFTNTSPQEIHKLNSYGSPSPVVEKGRVYVHFGTYGTACYDTNTLKKLWSRTDLSCTHSVGPGSSPVLYKNSLILTMDGIDVQYMIALNKETGDTVWKTPRRIDYSNTHEEMRKSFCTPRIVETATGPQLISQAAQAAFAYNPDTGKEIWRIPFVGYSNASRLLVGHDMAYFCTGFNRAELIAVRLDGKGDLSQSKIAWRYGKAVPTKPSPLLVDDLLYLISDGGIVTCLEAKTGNEVWKERLEGNYSASPIVTNNLIYFFSQEGKATLLKTGRKFEKVGENTMSKGFMASPAVSGKNLYLRTEDALYCIGD